MKPSRSFLIAFTLITALEILGEELGIKSLVYGCKPLIMILLMGWTAAHRESWQNSRVVRWLFVGMVFAWLGDVLLMIREVDMFGPGLGSFLLMQVCYVLAFRQEIRESKEHLSGQRLLLRALPFALFAGAFLSYLYTPFHQTPGTAGLWIPVIVYVTCLCSMAVMAAMRREVVPPANYQTVLLGAVLFVLSDSVIALNKFALPFAGAGLVIMATYAAAQYLIVTGVVGWNSRLI
jgi:uncharacterized membrane protein YhhN